ncbi:unnamed protein product [Sphagnum jensenii]|uniref:Uncharacterized protein n=1 Tax=Sphagnum jensenii TaxID=128206 RepID=A0ABP0V9F3_9BRYO
MLQQINEKTPKIKHMTYYEGDLQKMITKEVERPSLYDGKISPAFMAALWDVAHTTGSNILVNDILHAFLIVSKHIKLFDLLQAAMRMRGLGGQKLELVVSDEDRNLIADKLFKYLNIKVGQDEPLSVDHIIQYALLNEYMQETENNWRAIDKRMNMALMGPILKILWDESTPPDDALKVFELVESLFIRKRGDEAWGQYGKSVQKIKVEEGKKLLLDSWLNHPVLKAIQNNPKLFRNIQIDAIRQELHLIANAYAGPLQETVDSHSDYAKKTMEREKGLEKIKVYVKDREKVNKRETIKFTDKELPKLVERNLPPLRREPYDTRPFIPLPLNIFDGSSYKTVSLKEAHHLNYDQLAALTDQGEILAITPQELFALNPDLKNTLLFNDPDLSISLNIAHVWKNIKGVASTYAPYHFFQKHADHALLIEDRKTGKSSLSLLTSKRPRLC